MASIPPNQAKLAIRVAEIVQNGKRAERRKISHEEQNPQFIPLSSQRITVFSLQFFSMIYQAMNRIAGIPDSLLTSQKKSNHVRNTKPISPGGGSTLQASAMKVDHTAPETPWPARVPKARHLHAWINTSSSSAGLEQRVGFFLCIYIYTQMQVILKWLRVHKMTVLEAAQ